MSDRERRHFAAIAKAKELERAERLCESLERHPFERMRDGLALGDVAGDAAVEAALDKRALGQAGLARRGRALGMRGSHGGPRNAS